jgi:hypothetical protein
MNRLNGELNGNRHRNGNGQYGPGNPGGPGRPRRVAEGDYLRALAEECPPETWRSICQRAVANALAGDGKARDWLSRYLLGHPAELPTLGAVTSQPEGPKHGDDHR